MASSLEKRFCFKLPNYRKKKIKTVFRFLRKKVFGKKKYGPLMTRENSEVVSMAAKKEWIESAFTCGICSNTVTSPVRMTCEGEHLFCFGCIFDYYKARPASEINCPNCRHGNGSVLICNKLNKLLHMYHDALPEADRFELANNITNEERVVTITDYRRLFPSLCRRFPVAMEESAGSSVILGLQMGLFVRNYNTLIDVEQGTPPPLEGREWFDEEGQLMRRMPLGTPVLPRITLMADQPRESVTGHAFRLFSGFTPVVHSPPQSPIRRSTTVVRHRREGSRREQMITILSDLESLAIANDEMDVQ